MKGFRKAASPPQPTVSGGVCPKGGSSSLTSAIVAELGDGQTPQMVASRRGLPLDFVDLVFDRAIADGRLDFFELKPGDSTKGTCDPDSESLVCAGCPIMPTAIRRQQSLFGHMKAKISERNIAHGVPAAESGTAKTSTTQNGGDERKSS